ncbi:TALE/PBX transcription factor [Pseudoloma neurophilia]|uniref:TALE/PBX transcription factor n=1 Tax=Pseudoloma neurophilia TaxID=146866 RepID=A0A0R0M573_9MICR|nr:TALE/PBX transcription factor [Pseudoloma neurophilia]
MISSFELLQILCLKDKLFYEKKIEKQDLQDVLICLKQHISLFQDITGDSHERDCCIAFFILLKRFKAEIELQDKIENHLDQRLRFFEEQLAIVMESLENLQNTFDQENEITSAFEQKSTKITKSNKQKRVNYSRNITKVLRDWLALNMLNPYPSEIQKAQLSVKTGLDQNQINNWFINARRRILPLMRQKTQNY